MDFKINETKERDIAVVIVAGLSEMIRTQSEALAAEQHAPSRHVDDSDDFMKRVKNEIAKLRAMREEFENLVTGVV